MSIDSIQVLSKDRLLVQCVFFSSFLASDLVSKCAYFPFN